MTQSGSSFPSMLSSAWERLPVWVSALFPIAIAGLWWGLTARWFGHDIFVWTVVIVFSAVGSLAAWIDLAVFALPDALTWPLALAVLIVVVSSGFVSGDWDRVLRSVAASALAVVVGLILAVTTSLGLGDVKFGISIGLSLAFISWQALFGGLLLALAAGALTAIVLLLTGRSSNSYLPMGPYLFFGACFCFLTC